MKNRTVNFTIEQFRLQYPVFNHGTGNTRPHADHSRNNQLRHSLKTYYLYINIHKPLCHLVHYKTIDECSILHRNTYCYVTLSFVIKVMSSESRLFASCTDKNLIIQRKQYYNTLPKARSWFSTNYDQRLRLRLLNLEGLPKMLRQSS